MHFRHPALDELAGFAAGALPPAPRRRVASHAQSCTRCQASLRFVRRLVSLAPALSAADPALLGRVLASRAAGARVILPAAPEPRNGMAERSGLRAIRWAAASLVLVAAGAPLFSGPRRLSAVGADSELVLAPESPGAGAEVRVSYRPGPGLFPGEDSLVLRARFRTLRDGMYRTAVPAVQTRAVAVLRRTAGGYAGSFTLPSGAVFAALAVEAAGALVVDDRGGRFWEVLIHGDDGRPTFNALEQRVNDLMGRSWEEGYATARRLTELYPARIAAWTLREFFERALYGDDADSVTRSYQPLLGSLIAGARDLPLSAGDLETVFYRAWTAARRGGAADSAELAFWWTRLSREHPRSPQVAQRLAIDMQLTPRATLDSAEALYPRLAPLEGPGQNLVNVARWAAEQANDEAAFRRWSERGNAGRPDSALTMALLMAGRARFRTEGLAALRALLQGPPARLAVSRRLEWTAGEQRRSEAAARRRALAALGRALLATGDRDAALDTLRLASEGAWDLNLFRNLATAYTTAGDRLAAAGMHARLVADPRTRPAEADSLGRLVVDTVGPLARDSLVLSARREMLARLKERSTDRPLRGTSRLHLGDGRARTLQETTGPRPSVVIFWSRHCGPAIEALPAIRSVAERLRRQGTPVVFVVDEAPSEVLRSFLAERGWTDPVYHDVQGSTKAAFGNFGTPAYYVLDAAGRVRFTWADGEAELLAQVWAVSE